MSNGPHPHPQSPEVIRRLKRIEGHVRAVRQMAEEGRPCADVIHQIGAIEAALRRVANAVLSDHLDRCIASSVGDTQVRGLIGELKAALDTYVR
jgi:DNA-binding FrmR family transcriptional regulator